MNRLLFIFVLIFTFSSMTILLLAQTPLTPMEELGKKIYFDKIADPDFIEPKGYVYVGYSRERLEMENMPQFERILRFARRMSEITGYEMAGENRPSRVVLLSNGRSPLTIEER